MLLDERIIEGFHLAHQKSEVVFMPYKGDLIERIQLEVGLRQFIQLFAAFYTYHANIIVVVC